MNARNEHLRLAALGRYQILDTPAEQQFDQLTALAASICGTAMAVITLVDERRQWFKSRVGIDVSETPRDIAFCNHTIEQDDLFLVPDACEDPRFEANPLVAGAPNIRFYAGMPLRTSEGQAVGSLAVLDRIPRSLTEQQQQALRVLARQAVVELELRSSLERLKQALAAEQRSEELLRQSHAELEQRVRERTEQLDAARAELQRKFEEQAKEARESQSIIDSLPGVFYLFNADGSYLRWNRNLELLYGVDSAAMQKAKPEDFVDEADKQVVRKGIAEVLEQGESSIELDMKTADGRIVPHLFSGTRIEVGGQTCVVGMGIDISKLRKAQENLRLRDRAIQASMNAILITDLEGNIDYVNPAFERITGYGNAESRGRNPRFLQNDDRAQPGLAALREAVHRRHEVSALLRNYRRNGEMFWNAMHIAPVPDAGGKVTHFVGIFNDVTELKHYEEELERQANVDALTSLPNRSVLHDRIGHAIATAARHAEPVAVGFIDLDNFKFINDSLGHKIGDELLKQVAQRLCCCLREQDTVARYGGDEFAFILCGQLAERSIPALMDRILKTIRRPFAVDGHEFFVSCSIGLSFYPKDGQDADTLLKNADIAMYRAKERGRNNYQFYTASMNRRVTQRLALESRLRQALERNEFTLHYQPKVELRSGRVVGAEALLRWQRADGKVVAPNNFVPLAEETGLIVPIGEWALRTACMDNKSLQDAGLPPIRVAVNISARQFEAECLSVLVRSALQTSGLRASDLELELTESLVMRDPQEAVNLLLSLKELGVHLAIDDFGTGYSSLSYLQRFPVDHLKIDQSFVRDIGSDPNDAIIAGAVIALGHSLGMSVIAEGVSSKEQLAFLQLHACDQMQGFLFSRPVPLQALAALIGQNHSSMQHH